MFHELNFIRSSVPGAAVLSHDAPSAIGHTPTQSRSALEAPLRKAPELMRSPWCGRELKFWALALCDMFSLNCVLNGACPLLSPDELSHDYVNSFWSQDGYDGPGVTNRKFKRMKIMLEVSCRPPARRQWVRRTAPAIVVQIARPWRINGEDSLPAAEVSRNSLTPGMDGRHSGKCRRGQSRSSTSRLKTNTTAYTGSSLPLPCSHFSCFY